ncbi:IPT/TIG domain-containing protein [Actinoplanes sp. NPDC051861]|uniref:beta strand repeat-containing protein n=1 Tax=Actinoplanes sp. NPDC051861 TaxID=3155170 RepID=UPI0034443A04
MRNSLQRRRTRLLGAGLVTGAVVVAITGTQLPALAAPLANMTGGGPTGSTVYAAGMTANANATIGAIFTTATSCPSTYNTTAPNVAAGSPTKLSSTSGSFTVPTTLTLNTGGLPKTYYVCVYNGTTVGTSSVIGDATPFALTPAATLTPTSGASGGGNTVTINAPATSTTLFSTTAPYVAFASSTTGCGQVANDSAPANIAATSTTKVSATQLTAVVPPGVGGPNNTSFAVCAYTESGGSGTLLAVGSYSVTLPAVTQSSTVGPELASVTLTATSAFLTGITPAAEVVAPATTTTTTACPALYTTPTSDIVSATVRKISNYKAAVTMPSDVDEGEGPWSICLYTEATNAVGKLLAAGQYAAAAVPTLATVSPSSGTPLGGSQITIKGANLPTTAGSITANLGGTPLVVTPVNETTFTAVTPQNSLGSKALTISTATGTATLPGAFTYVNSLAVAPNTAPNTATAQDIDVQGTGFLEYTFANTANVSAHVYLVAGRWVGTEHATISESRANVNAVADCLNVLVISDNELVCALDLAHALGADGAPTDNDDGSRSATGTPTTVVGTTISATDANFTRADIGKPVTATGGTGTVAANAVIVQVIDETTAIMSAAGTAGNPTSFTIGSTRNVTANADDDATSLTAAPGTFTTADVGKYVSGTGVEADSFITGVNESGSTATLSLATTAAINAGTIAVKTSNAVPSGAYNVTVVSDADPDNASVASVTSSGSTFTVAPF